MRTNRVIELTIIFAELLPDYPNPEQARKITLKHMLSHTSGLQDYAAEIDSIYVRTGVDPSKEDIYTLINRP